MIKREQLGLLHIYPSMAGLSETERRQIMVETCGVYSSKQLDQGGFDIVMARFEEELWGRVDSGSAPDPRRCRICGRGMIPVRGRAGMGQCVEGCEKRKVAAWQKDYWRKRLPQNRQAGRRAVWMLGQLWKTLQDYLEPNQRTGRYLAGILARTDGLSPDRFLDGDRLDWNRISAQAAHRAIDALKDRLKYAVK